MVKLVYGKTNMKKRIIIEITDHDAREFKKRCIDYDTDMSKVLRPHVEEFMRTHPPKIERLPRVD